MLIDSFWLQVAVFSFLFISYSSILACLPTNADLQSVYHDPVVLVLSKDSVLPFIKPFLSLIVKRLKFNQILSYETHWITINDHHDLLVFFRTWQAGGIDQIKTKESHCSETISSASPQPMRKKASSMAWKEEEIHQERWLSDENQFGKYYFC